MDRGAPGASRSKRTRTKAQRKIPRKTSGIGNAGHRGGPRGRLFPPRDLSGLFEGAGNEKKKKRGGGGGATVNTFFRGL